ncbi:MAG: hypothetical protein ACOCP4_07210 [Candidatus Woesearchaeota archaeon]
MNEDKIERCMVKAILSLIDNDEGVVVKDIDNKKYIIYSAYPEMDNAIKIEKITTDDDRVVQDLDEGQMVYLNSEE